MAEQGKLVERKLFAGARVRRLRREQRLTQAAMAEALGISTSYLNLIERDQRPISAQILLQLVECLTLTRAALPETKKRARKRNCTKYFPIRCFATRRCRGLS